MKLINLLFLLIPVMGISQVTIDTKFTEVYYVDTLVTKILDEFEYNNNRYILHSKGWRKDSIFKTSFKPKLNNDTVRIDVDSFVIGDYKIQDNKVYIKPYNLGATKVPEFYNATQWLNHVTETVRGKVETPINVMDSGMKVEVVETRDTIYKCPLNSTNYAIQYFNVNGEIENHLKPNNCVVDKIITTRRYKLYIINEYGQKEYLKTEFGIVK